MSIIHKKNVWFIYNAFLASEMDTRELWTNKNLATTIYSRHSTYEDFTKSNPDTDYGINRKSKAYMFFHVDPVHDPSLEPNNIAPFKLDNVGYNASPMFTPDITMVRYFFASKKKKMEEFSDKLPSSIDLMKQQLNSINPKFEGLIIGDVAKNFMNTWENSLTDNKNLVDTVSKCSLDYGDGYKLYTNFILPTRKGEDTRYTPWILYHNIAKIDDIDISIQDVIGNATKDKSTLFTILKGSETIDAYIYQILFFILFIVLFATYYRYYMVKTVRRRLKKINN